MNQVIDKHNAEISGKRTALSGCNTRDCVSRPNCLRADERLAVRARYRASDCRYMIPTNGDLT